MNRREPTCGTGTFDLARGRGVAGPTIDVVADVTAPVCARSQTRLGSDKTMTSVQFDSLRLEVSAMFPFDPRSAAQIFEADLLVAHHRRTRGPVVSQHIRWWTALFARDEAAWTSTHELFTGLGRNQLKRAAKKFTVLDVESGQSLGSQGDVATGFVAILEGQIGVTINGAPHAVLDDGSHFGAIGLLDEQSATLKASYAVMAPSRVAIADPDRFGELLAEYPTVAKRIHSLADIRRAYLAGVASTDTGERPNLLTLNGFPAHIEDPYVRL